MLVREFLGKAVTAVDELVGVSVEETCLYRMSRQGEALPGAAPGAGLSLGVLEAGDLQRLREVGPLRTEEGSKRLSRGDLCYVAYVDGRLAHYTWVQRSGLHPILEAGRREGVSPGEFWIYNCRTAEWARGRGIYPAVLTRVVREHFETGYSTAWIYTSRWNISSQKGIQRAGFGFVRSWRALRVGRRYYRLA